MAFRATQALRMVVKKTSTGLAGLAVDVNARAKFIALQKQTLEKIKVRCCWWRWRRRLTLYRRGETLYSRTLRSCRILPRSQSGAGPGGLGSTTRIFCPLNPPSEEIHSKPSDVLVLPAPVQFASPTTWYHFAFLFSLG